MEEKVLIEGQFYDGKDAFKKAKKIAIIAIIVLTLCQWILPATFRYMMGSYWFKLEGYDTIFSYVFGDSYGWELTIIGFLITLAVSLAVLLFIKIYFSKIVSKWSITITDKRTIGQIKRGLRLDLPIDKISSVSQSYFSGISIGTSSGRITFRFLKNRNEVFEALSELLNSNQPVYNHQTTTPKATGDVETAEALLKYKELLDQGIIGQEEFETKKKQLLKI